MTLDRVSGQTFSRWFTEWPSTHERAGQMVEVIAVEALAEEHRLGDDGAGSYPSNPARDRPPSMWRRLVGPWERLMTVADGPRITHGRHCLCSACARQDWAEPGLAPCGMHGSSCPPVYDPWGRAGDPVPEGRRS